jgi:hypothetical protein
LSVKIVKRVLALAAAVGAIGALAAPASAARPDYWTVGCTTQYIAWAIDLGDPSQIGYWVKQCVIDYGGKPSVHPVREP